MGIIKYYGSSCNLLGRLSAPPELFLHIPQLLPELVDQAAIPFLHMCYPPHSFSLILAPNHSPLAFLLLQSLDGMVQLGYLLSVLLVAHEDLSLVLFFEFVELHLVFQDDLWNLCLHDELLSLDDGILCLCHNPGLSTPQPIVL